jgi:tetratricopeptide (TPR) repeat protein
MLLASVRALLIGFASVLAFAAAPAQIDIRHKPDEDAIKAYSSAQDFKARRDWRSARVELLNAVEADPKWADARLALAETALQIFDPVLALEQLVQVKALGVDPRNYAHLLAHAQWMAGRPQDAIATLAEQPIATRHLPYAYRVLGRAQLDVGDSVAAGQTFDRGLAIAPDDSMLWTEIGRLRMVASNQAGAIDALDRAVQLDPDNIRALELRGRMVRNQFGLLAALPWFEKGLAIDPNDVPLLEEYGSTLGDAGRYKDMLAQARRIVQLDSGNRRAIYMQAVLAARAGDYALARRLLERLRGGFGELPGPQLLRAICEYELDNPNKAIEILAPLSNVQPNNEAIRLMLARAMHKSGDHYGAWQALAPLVQRGDAGTYAKRLAGRILEAQGRRDEAAPFLDGAAFASARNGEALGQSGSARAIAEEAGRKPTNARAVIPHIRILVGQGRLGEARTAATLLLSGNEGVADAQLLMGDIEWLSGNKEAAISAYQRARSLSFSRPVLTRLAAAYHASGNDRAAGDLIAAFAVYNPNDLVGQRMLAFHLMDQEDWARALPLMLRVRARLGYNDSVINANIARALSELGRHEEAIRMARLAYRIDPGSLMATRIYGSALVKASQQPSTARALLRKARKLAPADPEIVREYRAAEAMQG